MDTFYDKAVSELAIILSKTSQSTPWSEMELLIRYCPPLPDSDEKLNLLNVIVFCLLLLLYKPSFSKVFFFVII